MNTTAPVSHATLRNSGSSGDRATDTAAMRRIGTVADLTEILASMHPQTPVILDPVLRGAVGLSPDHHPHAVVADMGATAYVCSELERGRPVRALELGARLIPEAAAQIPSETYACDPLHRMAEAFDAGDLGDGLRAVADALSDAAGQLTGEATLWLAPRSPLVEQLTSVAAVLRSLATELRSSLASAADAEIRQA
ncbi:hypothetical protein WEI85_07535 [Actinomycetes bacterium KLBMP 9797]